MSKIDLHIVAFDVPFPPDYGGVIDVFYKLKALHEEGVKIHLHCFEYGRGERQELKEWCKELSFYKRDLSFWRLLGNQPYIVSSRNHPQLLEKLSKDQAPILFEGLHSSAFLTHPQLKGRQKWLRMHNVEHEYYSGLARSAKNWKEQLYLKREARRLKQFESVLRYADRIFAISLQDQQYFSKAYKKAEYLPVFHPFSFPLKRPQLKDYVLYQGNLGVAENERAALFFLDQVITKESKWKIAGKAPSKYLLKRASGLKHASMIANPSSGTMRQLLEEAKVHALYTEQPTGIKLKLLAALYSYGFCLVNDLMVQGTGLESFCELAENKEEWKQKVKMLLSKELAQTEWERRKSFLEENFNNRKNAKLLLK